MLTFTTATNLYHQHLRAKRRAPTTLTWYDEQFAAYQTWRRAANRPDAIPTPDDLDAYLADQHTNHRAATVHARYRALRALCNWLQKRKKIAAEENPFTILDADDAPHVPSEIPRHATKADVERLLASITPETWLDHRDRTIIMILFYSGLRRGELCRLKVGDIDTTTLSITIQHAKGDKSRVVPCVDALRPALAAYLYSRPQHSDLLLLASDGYTGVRGALTAEGIRQMLIRRCAQAGIEYLNPHAFRHGFAMWLLNAGARLTTVSTAMGHSDPNITHKVYAHTTTETVRTEYEEALRRLR